MHGINLIQIILIALVTFVADVANALDERQFHHPLVACILTGITLSSPAVGVMVGGSLELLVLDWINVDAAMAPDSTLASIASTTIAMASVGDAFPTKSAIATTIDVAIPLIVVGRALTIFVRTIAIFFAHQIDHFAGQANYRGIAIMYFTTLGLQELCVAIPITVVTTLASDDTIKHAPDVVPKVTIGDLGITGDFIVVADYVMAINIMKARKLIPFFFLGFIFATFATTVDGSVLVGDHSKGINKWAIDLASNGTVFVALGILGAYLTVIYVQLSPELHDSARLPAAAPPAANDGSSNDLDDDLDDGSD